MLIEALGINFIGFPAKSMPVSWPGKPALSPHLLKWYLCLSYQHGEKPTKIPAKSVCLSAAGSRSEEHTSELQSLMRISYAVFCLKKQNTYYIFFLLFLFFFF